MRPNTNARRRPLDLARSLPQGRAMGQVDPMTRFTIHEEIGSGGMAIVHRATETLRDGSTRDVAIKRPRSDEQGNHRWLEYLAHEAAIMKSLDHPNVVRTYESGPWGDSSFFISMEYIEGYSLSEVLRGTGGKIPPAISVSFLRDLCAALDHIHNAEADGKPLGLIHRDISPANLIVDLKGRLRVLDFGIAKTSLAGEQTSGTYVKGKLGYLAPEALTRTEALDARSDLFSVGIVAHELLAGRPLFSTKNAKMTVARALNSHVRPPSDYNPACPDLLDALVLKALTRTRSQRSQSAAELRLILDAIAETLLPCSPAMVAMWFQSTFDESEADSYDLQISPFANHTIVTAHDYVPVALPLTGRRRALTLPLRPTTKCPIVPRRPAGHVTFREPTT